MGGNRGNREREREREREIKRTRGVVEKENDEGEIEKRVFIGNNSHLPLSHPGVNGNLAIAGPAGKTH